MLGRSACLCCQVSQVSSVQSNYSLCRSAQAHKCALNIFCSPFLVRAAAMPLDRPQLLMPKELTFVGEAKLPEVLSRPVVASAGCACWLGAAGLRPARRHSPCQVRVWCQQICPWCCQRSVQCLTRSSSVHFACQAPTLYLRELRRRPSGRNGLVFGPACWSHF